MTSMPAKKKIAPKKQESFDEARCHRALIDEDQSAFTEMVDF